MKALKVLAVAAVFGCYVFGSAGVSAQQICPIGAGACRANPTPASSYSTARAVDLTPRLPVVDPFGPSARGTLTTGVLAATLANMAATLANMGATLANSGATVTYFCVAGEGIDLGKIVNWNQSACPTGSGAIVLSTEALSPGM